MSSLTIARHRATYFAPAALPAGVLRQQLDRVMAQELPAALARQIEPYALDSEPGVWLIRKLDVETSLLDVGVADPSVLGRAWAQQAGHSLRQLLRRGSDGQNVLYFAGRAAYLTQFLTDLLAGSAWSRWYYQPFAHLRSLPLNAAVRQLLLQEEADAEVVLVNMASAQRLDPLLAALGSGGCARLLTLCHQGVISVQVAAPQAAHPETGPTIGLAATIDQLLPLWHAAGPPSQPPFITARNQLRLWLAWRAAHPGVQPTRTLVQAIDQLLHLAGRLHSGGQVKVTSGWPGRAAAVIGPQSAGASQRAAAADSVYVTPYGALFLLLPSLVDLDLPNALAATSRDPVTQAIWRTWLVAKCLGRARWEPACQSELVWQIMGLDTPPTAAQLTAAAQAATPAVCTEWRQALIATLQRQGRLSRRAVSVEEVTAHGYPAPVWLVRDMLADYWLWAGTEEPSAALLAALVAGERASVWVRRGGADAAQDAAPDDSQWSSFLRQSKPAAALLDYLTVYPVLPPALDLALTLAAAAVLRSFARRLMGFGWSGFDHLYRNFLAGESRVLITLNAVQVDLPLSPLHSILRMGGVNGSQYTLPWLGERVVVLRLAEDG